MDIYVLQSYYKYLCYYIDNYLFSIHQDCQNVSQAKMRCVTPTFQSSDLLNSDLDFEEPLMLSYGFIMDEVHSLRNLTELTLGQRLFGLYPNPEFDPFDEGIRSVFQIKKHDDLLTITVSYGGIMIHDVGILHYP